MKCGCLEIQLNIGGPTTFYLINWVILLHCELPHHVTKFYGNKRVEIIQS